MSTLRGLILLDLRSNLICNILGYKDAVYNTFPLILHLDAKDVDPVEQVNRLLRNTTLTNTLQNKFISIKYFVIKYDTLQPLNKTRESSRPRF